MNASAVTRRLAQVSSVVARAVGRVREPLDEMRIALRGEGTVEGAHHLPETGPVIVVANHRHALDGRVLVAHLPRPATLIGMDALDRAVRDRRAHESGSRDAWARAVSALGEGRLVVVFPEGSPSPDAAVHRGRTSLGWLLAASQRLATPVPVVPVALDARRATVRLGPMIDLSRWAQVSVDRTIARAIVDEVMTPLLGLVGAGYVDSYTTTARAQRRSAGQRRRDAQRLAVLARREAEMRAAARHRAEAEVERREMARLEHLAAEQARQHAVEAAARDRARLGGE